MQCIETKLPGVLILDPDVYRDSRGFFLERYNRARYRDFPGLDAQFVQDNHSQSRRGVLRGLHLQRRHPQGKLVSAVNGSVWDVAVDIDPQSPTFRQWVGVQLSGENHRQLYIPPGYAHGFCALSDRADVLYKCTQFRHADDECGILWNDAQLAIAWRWTTPSCRTRMPPTRPCGTTWPDCTLEPCCAAAGCCG